MARMHCKWVRCQSASEYRRRIRLQMPSSVLTKLTSGDTVAEFMYSSLLRSTVTSAPFSFSVMSLRTGDKKAPGVRESLTPRQATVPFPFAREALMIRPSCTNCHFSSDIGVPRRGHGHHVVGVIAGELETPFEPDAINPQHPALLGVGQ